MSLTVEVVASTYRRRINTRWLVRDNDGNFWTIVAATNDSSIDIGTILSVANISFLTPASEALIRKIDNRKLNWQLATYEPKTHRAYVPSKADVAVWVESRP